MILAITTLARPVDDVDLSDLTTAVRTGAAHWTDEGLDVPFDRDLTDDEAAAVVLRLTSSDPTQEEQRATAAAFCEVSEPSLEQVAAQVRVLTQLVLKLIDPPTDDPMKEGP